MRKNEKKNTVTEMPKKHIKFEEFVQDANQVLPRRTPEEIADLLVNADISWYDRKMITNTVNEMIATALMLKDIRHIPKITVFGSARTKPDHPDYILCKNFCKQLSQLGFMTITGAGPGIMAAGHEGAGKDKSIGVSIDLPFEVGANEFSLQSKYLITYKYFFNRKLAFVREADGIVLFPGGFGTMDEAFEALTLLHTGRSMPVPLVLMEHEGSNYWEHWLDFIRNGLLKEGMINDNDLYLFRRFKKVDDAIDYIGNFYRRYHSLRYYKDTVIIRLSRPVPESLLDDLREEYADFLGDFGIQKSEALPVEKNETDIAELPRLLIKANRKRPVDLYCFVRSLNREVAASTTRSQDRQELTQPAAKKKTPKKG